MTAHDLKIYLEGKFKDVLLKNTYGETTFFYNPKKVLPNGVYFCTIKENDGPNDKSSQLDRDGVYRLSFKPHPTTYFSIFGNKPKRPLKGQHINIECDLAEKNVWMPHSVYAWMGWTMVLSPNENQIKKLWPYIEESYSLAKEKFEKKI